LTHNTCETQSGKLEWSPYLYDNGFSYNLKKCCNLRPQQMSRA